jgi:hypothetical protein
MVRESLAGNSKHFFANLNASSGFRVTYRSATGGESAAAGTASGTIPNTWLRLVRSGNTFTGYWSTNGTAWNAIGSATFAMNSTLYFGMAVLSHDSTKLATAQFRNLEGTYTPATAMVASP